jgi:hypothetical protein
MPDDDRKKHAPAPAPKTTDDPPADGPLSQPPGPSPAPNPESAPGGDTVGGQPPE